LTTYIGQLNSRDRSAVVSALRENDRIETDYDRDRSEAIRVCIEGQFEDLRWILGQPDDSYLDCEALPLFA